jgi:protein SCO1/2
MRTGSLRSESNNSRQAFRGLLAVTAALCVLGTLPAQAQDQRQKLELDPQDRMLKEVRLEQRLDGEVPVDTRFKDETGKDVRFGDYLKKPVLLMMIQLRCTMLCTQQLAVLEDSLKDLKFTPGKEFDVVVVSIDPREQPDLAKDMKAGFLQRYGRAEAAPGVHFLTGADASIKPLAQAVGLHYAYDARTDQFAHPDGLMVITPKARVARYFFRLEYPPRDLRFALVEAADNKIGTVIDAIALLCFHYNPMKGTYSLAVLNVVRLASIATVLFMALWVLVMRRRDGKAPLPGPAAAPQRAES